MTTIEAIRAELIANAGVQALLGVGAAARIYANVMPQPPVYPAVVLTVVSDVPIDSLTSGLDRTVNVRLQVDARSKNYLEAHAVGDAVEAVIANLTTSDLSALREVSRDLYDNEAQVHRCSSDYSVFR